MKIYKIAEEKKEDMVQDKVPTPTVVEEELVFGDLKLYIEGQTADEEPAIVKKPEEYLPEIEAAVDEPAQLFLLTNGSDYQKMVRFFQDLYGDMIENWVLDTSTKPR